jgi:integrase/recombinase XerD
MNIQNIAPATQLRQRMIEDMRARNLGRHSQRSHLGSCELFLIESGASICSRNRVMTGLKFLLRVTLRRHDLAAEIYHLKEPQKIPLVMSRDEVRRLLAMAPSLKARVMLSLAYGCGMRAGEVVRLRAGDIDCYLLSLPIRLTHSPTTCRRR